MILTAESARFFAVMAAMTRSGVTLADSLGVASNAVIEPQLRGQLEDLQRGLMEGGVWTHLIDDVDALPMAVRKLLVAAERSGDMAAALSATAEDLAKEVDTRAERLLALMEPAIIVLMFGLIGTVVMSLMLPMLKLSSSVQ
jgi:general secretion pathway protein F